MLYMRYKAFLQDWALPYTIHSRKYVTFDDFKIVSCLRCSIHPSHPIYSIHF